MRICFIVGAFPSVSETFILEQVTGLLDRGHEVLVYAGARSRESVVHDKALFRGLSGRVRLYHDRPASRLLRVLRFMMILPLAFMRAPGAVLRSLNVLRFGREAVSLNLFFRAWHFLEVRDFDAVLCHFGPNGLVGLEMKEVDALRGKLVTVFHASDITSFVARCGQDVYRELFAKGDLFLAVSEDARKRLISLGCPPDKIRVQRMGIDLKAFPFVERKLFAGPTQRILSVARLVEKKGIIYALEAMVLLKKAGRDCLYTVVGDGPLRPELEARAQELGFADRVRFTGAQPASCVREMLSEADVLLAPSVRADNGDEEGIPVVLMEAMASGVPVVTTLTGGVGELVTGGVTGFVVPQKDPRALADAVLRLQEDPSGTQQMVMAARRAIEGAHDAARLDRQLVDVFTEAFRDTAG